MVDRRLHRRILPRNNEPPAAHPAVLPRQFPLASLFFCFLSGILN
jgi:hypothetical protein